MNNQADRLITRVPFYYGWVILIIGSLGLIFTSPGQTYGVSIFIEHFIADFGISRSLISTIYTGGTLSASLLLSVVGRQIDHRGARLMMALISLFLALACFYMAFVQNAWMLLLGFFALRLFGQGSLSLVSNNVINQWWVARRGRAAGLSGIGQSFVGLGGFPNLIQWLIVIVGWRTGYVVLGLGVALVMVPLALIFLRDTPEAVGLVPDGRATAVTTTANASPSPSLHSEENWTRAEAVRTLSFWIIAGGGLVIGMFTTGLTFHLVSIFNDNGFPASTAANILFMTAIGTAVANLVGGYLSDRIGVRYIMAAALVLQSLTMVMAPQMTTLAMAVIFGLLLGTLSGLSRSVNVVVWPNYFGRRHLGSITGFAFSLMVLGSALGPLPMGIARDILGNYTLVLNLLAIIPLVLALFTLIWAKPPVRRTPDLITP